IVAEVGAQRLERDLAIELRIERGVDHAHAAGAEAVEDEVAPELGAALELFVHGEERARAWVRLAVAADRGRLGPAEAEPAGVAAREVAHGRRGRLGVELAGCEGRPLAIGHTRHANILPCNGAGMSQGSLRWDLRRPSVNAPTRPRRSSLWAWLWRVATDAPRSSRRPRRAPSSPTDRRPHTPCARASPWCGLRRDRVPCPSARASANAVSATSAGGALTLSWMTSARSSGGSASAG